MKTNEVNFMHHRKVHHRFMAGDKKIRPWLLGNGYQEYPKFRCSWEVKRRFDNYFQKEMGGFTASDEIWARSPEEAEALNRYLVANP